MSVRNEYFAAQESRDLVQDLEAFVGRWQNTIGSGTEGMTAVWHRNLKYYYSNIFYGAGSDSGLEFVGDQGELVKMMVPQARSLNQQFLSLTTKQKLNFEPLAESTDAATLADTRVAKGLCDQVLFDEKVDQSASVMAEQSTLMGAGYLEIGWNMLKGIAKAGNPETGEVKFSGYIDIRNLSVFDVIFDMTKENFYKLDHMLVRTVENRWDLIAKYPHLADALKKIQPIFRLSDTSMIWQSDFSEDSVYVYKFYHKTTPALPKGRLTMFCDSETIMFDNENPYKDPSGNAFIPVVQMRPEPIMGSGYGYPFFSNILPLQEMLDHSFSAIATNQSANAVQSILNPLGNDIGVMNVGGLRFLNYRPMADSSGGKPEALQLTKSAPETYKFADMIRSYMMEIYNVNGALRGQPPPGVTSGTAIATLTTNALEFSQNFTKAYVDACETAMTYTIWNFAQFADEDMTVSILGENNRSIVKTFTGGDLKNIRRVRVKIANPLMATAAGRLQVADNLMDKGKLNVNKYFKVLEGAPVETLYDVEFNQENLIQLENDDLRQGIRVQGLMTDNHPQHVINHLSLLDDPEVRRNGTFVQNVLDHVLEHEELAQELMMNPMLMQMLTTGQMPVGMAPPPGAVGGPGIAPPPPPPADGMNPGSGAGKRAKPAKSPVPDVNATEEQTSPAPDVAPPGGM